MSRHVALRRIWKYVWYCEHCTYLVLCKCICLCAALAECSLALYTFLSTLIVMSSDVVKHECCAGYARLLFRC